MTNEQNFTADVKIAGINPYVDVPEYVVNELGGGTKAAVLVKVIGIDSTKTEDSVSPKKKSLAKDAARLKTIGRLAPGGWFRTTLVPLRTDATRLYLDKWMRESAGADVGNRVRIWLKPDRDSRELPLPAPLLEAMNTNVKVKAAWDALAPSRQREILTYLNFLKTPEALEHNVQKTIANLLR